MTVLSLSMGIVMAWAGPLGALAKVDERLPLTPLLVGVPGLVVFTVLSLRILQAAVAGSSAGGAILTSAMVAVVLMLTQDGHLWSWGLLAPAWASGAALLLNRSATIAACVAAAVVGPLLTSPVADLANVFAPPYADDPRPLLIIYLVVSVVAPWTNRFQLWFWQVVRAAEEGREAQARLAVTEERLRFSRDLHDLVGHSLTAIAVKSEVAVKLSRVDIGRSTGEMEEVRTLARQALKEIRAAVRGYRTVDLAAELRGMIAVLEAGGVRCTLKEPGDQVPEKAATLLAWVVREGTTNVLRHSFATRCRIAITIQEGNAVLEMTNDGVAEIDGVGGTGLIGLSERVTATGGSVTGGPGGPGEFRLRATVPLEEAR
ncbi:sensor histidine kinase [Streptosporangium amethystogenes subsp. fukuiense]|uniref:Sensor histidine kinase n=1 Tax=Streptosporangium amethystogenes subsp. fukuiense TaxID=698418 RepID=A0ABW2T2M8_9ACTN